MEAVNTRFGRWTEAGNQLLEEIGLPCPEADGLSGRDSFGCEVRAGEMIADAANHPRYCGFN